MVNGPVPLRVAAPDRLLETLDDPSLLLYRFDFAHGQAHFYAVSEDWPPEHCEQAVRNAPAKVVPIRDLLAATGTVSPTQRRPPAFIWITEFTGSTLFAKALHASGKFYLYNEPQVFAQLAVLWRRILYEGSNFPRERWHRLLATTVAQYAKTRSPSTIALVKEWPTSNLIAPSILSSVPSTQGLFFTAPLTDYLVGCLKDHRRRATMRHRVLQRFTERRSLPPLRNIDPEGLSDAQLASLHWLTIMYTHCSAQHSDMRILGSVSSRDFFADPATVLIRSAAHLGATIAKDEAARIVDGPVFATHAKKLRGRYSEAERRKDFRQWELLLATQIAEGLEFAGVITAEFPLPDRIHSSPGL